MTIIKHDPFIRERVQRILGIALEKGDIDMLATAIEAGADVSRPGTLDRACKHFGSHEKPTFLNYLLECGVSANQPDDEGEQGALIYMILVDNHQCIRALLNAGVRLDDSKKRGLSYLEQALHRGNERVLNLLKKAGANLLSIERPPEWWAQQTPLIQAWYQEAKAQEVAVQMEDQLPEASSTNNKPRL